MFSARIKGIMLLHLIVQLLGVVIVLWVAFGIVNGLRFSWTLDYRDYLEVTAVVLAALLFEFFSRPHETQSLSGLSKLQLMTVTHRQTIFAIVSIFGMVVMLKDDSLSRTFLTVFFLLYFLWLAWSNRFGYRFLIRLLCRDRKKGLSPTLLIDRPPALRK